MIKFNFLISLVILMSVSFSFPLFSSTILHFTSLQFYFSLFFSFLLLFCNQFHLLLYSFSYLLFFSFSAKGTYTRNHLNLLVELVHETLKTLDTAAKKHGSVPSQQQQQKKKQTKVISNQNHGINFFSTMELFMEETLFVISKNQLICGMFIMFINLNFHFLLHR